MKLATKKTLSMATDYLAHADPRLAKLIAVQDCTIQPHTDYYRALTDSIISQQLSVKAAATIQQRFRDLFGGNFPDPDQVVRTDHEALRSVGLSNAKARYVKDLAEHIVNQQLDFKTISERPNAEIIAMLTDVKGIGEWTAQMFLMFCMGRLDVLPTGDLGIRNGVRLLYGLKNAPSPKHIESIAEKYHWHPYESVASWYVWRALDVTPQI